MNENEQVEEQQGDGASPKTTTILLLLVSHKTMAHSVVSFSIVYQRIPCLTCDSLLVVKARGETILDGYLHAVILVIASMTYINLRSSTAVLRSQLSWHIYLLAPAINSLLSSVLPKGFHHQSIIIDIDIDIAKFLSN